MALAIKVENLSKAYQLGEISTGTLSRDLERWFAKVRGKEDPFLKIGELNDRTVTGTSDVVWSLKDINFEIQEGDAVGIIGRNGAGKSTLLKLLSRVTSPTSGSFKVKGRIASLLEVGTGFHPELTGRDNIYLNGAIMGMRKKEINKKFNEIVHFSGVERYIDTPVKRYSSGMYVRLAFAVAAHLESEILIVDEVLAVGDAEFQKKCLGKMDDVSKSEGRTIIFVSHNMAAIKNLCNRIIILNQGQINYNGDLSQGIKNYLDNQSGTRLLHYVNSKSDLSYGCEEIKIENKYEEACNEFEFNEEITISIKYRVDKKQENARISMRLTDHLERIIFSTEREIRSLINDNNNVSAKIRIPANVLVPNKYIVSIALHIPNVIIFELLKEIVSFEIIETGSEFQLYGGTDYGCVFVNCKWDNVN